MILAQQPTFDNRIRSVSSAALRTPVTFYELVANDSPEPGENKRRTLHKAYAEVYNSSQRDLTVLDSSEYSDSVTIRIRDTKGEYDPTTMHSVEIDDRRYMGKQWNIVQVRPDFANNASVTLVLRGVTYGS